MSWKRMDQVWVMNGFTTIEKFVLLALAHYENDKTGLCCPSCKTLSKDLNVSMRSVRYSICSLKEKGTISSKIISTRNGIVNSYSFNPIGGSARHSPCATNAQCATDAHSTENQGSANDDRGSAKNDAQTVQLLHPNREEITKKETGKKFNTTTTKPSPPQKPIGGGGETSSDDFDDDTFKTWLREHQREAERIHGQLRKELQELDIEGLDYFHVAVQEKTPQFAHCHEEEINKVLKSVYRNHGCDEDGTPVVDLISYLCDMVLGKRACFGIKIDPQPESENEQKTASTPSEPSERVSAPTTTEKRATAAPMRQICESAKPQQPKDRDFPTLAEIRDRLDAQFGDSYDRAAVLSAYYKLTEAGWKDANGQPIRDPFRYLAAIATAKQTPAHAEFEPYPDDETVRIWVDEDCQNGFYDLAAALAARDLLFDDQTLRKNLRCGIRAYIVGAARRADAQATVRLAVG